MAIQLDHLILKVSDRSQSIDFYTNILGLTYGDSFHLVGNMQGSGEETGSRGAGKVIYFFDPSKHLIVIRHHDV